MPIPVSANETFDPFENTIPLNQLPENCSWATVDEPFNDGPDYFKVDTFNVTPSWNSLIVQTNTSSSFLDIRLLHNDTLFSTYRLWFDNVTILTLNYHYDTLQLQVSSSLRGAEITMGVWSGNATTLPIVAVITDITIIIQNVIVTQNVTYTETVTIIQNMTQIMEFWNTSYVYLTETVLQYLPLFSDYSIWLPLTGSMFAVGSVITLYMWNRNNPRSTPDTKSAKEILDDIFEDKQNK
ncbi:MAG: hypothetical protein P1Q69_03840 [Candidatus Thorarchaeota archaeon]|nr:hypothetical protein [Candidatus Thorarchaeota archaeon]